MRMPFLFFFLVEYIGLILLVCCPSKTLENLCNMLFAPFLCLGGIKCPELAGVPYDLSTISYKNRNYA